MRIMYTIDSGQGLSLGEGTAPQPSAGPGQLLIRVHAAGVTTTELQWYPTTHERAGGVRLHAIPGHEFSGVVEQSGLNAGDSFQIGQKIFGMNDWFANGAMAEFCLAEESALAAKPANLTHAEAASIPIGALTAWQGLFDRANLHEGERLLVHGGAGAVGMFAVQLGKLHGAHVIATASARNMEFVKGLGADVVIDYRNSPFEESAGSVDVVFDTAGGETLQRSWAVLKPKGRMVTVVSTAEKSADPRVKDAFFIVQPNGKQLAKIGDLVIAGRLRTVVDAVFPLSQAAKIFREPIVRRGRGKIVIEVAAEP